MPDAVWTKSNAALLLLGAAGLALGLPLRVLVVGAAFSFSIYLALNRRWLQQYQPLGGYANLVTLSRLALLLLAASQYEVWHRYGLFLAFLAVIVSDGVDGYLARKYKQTSELGAKLDIETDALMCALLAGIHFVQETAGVWVLVAGNLRYFYVWGLFAAGAERARATPKPYTRLIGVLFISSLMGPFIVPPWLALPAMGLGSFLVSVSFIRSFYGKWRVSTRH